MAGSRPSWSPDGARLAVVRGNPEGGSDIWLIDSSGSGDETRLVGGAWETRSPSFSPDGATLAFISGEAGSLDIWTVPVTGGAATQLTHGTNPLDEPRWTPRWSPDGAWVAYVSSRSGERNNDDVWVVSADGKTHRQLSTGLMVNTDPAWSPDGSSLAVVANTVMEHWYGDDADVWRIPFAPGSMQQLTPNGGHSWRLEGAGLSWSLDGRTIYALSLRNGDKNVTAVPADGGVRTAVTNLDGMVTDFAISPDGESLAIVLAGPTSPPDLFVLPLGGRAAAAPHRLRSRGRDTTLSAGAARLSLLRRALLRRLSLSPARIRRDQALSRPDSGSWRRHQCLRQRLARGGAVVQPAGLRGHGHRVSRLERVRS